MSSGISCWSDSNCDHNWTGSIPACLRRLLLGLLVDIRRFLDQLRELSGCCVSLAISRSMWVVASFFPTCMCGVSALVLKGPTHIRVWSLLDSEGAVVGPFLLEHIRSP